MSAVRPVSSASPGSGATRGSRPLRRRSPAARCARRRPAPRSPQSTAAISATSSGRRPVAFASAHAFRFVGHGPGLPERPGFLSPGHLAKTVAHGMVGGRCGGGGRRQVRPRFPRRRRRPVRRPGDRPDTDARGRVFAVAFGRLYYDVTGRGTGPYPGTNVSMGQIIFRRGVYNTVRRFGR